MGPFASHLRLNLQMPDFTTANSVVEVINNSFSAGTAVAMDGSLINVLAPINVSQYVTYVAELENSGSATR